MDIFSLQNPRVKYLVKLRDDKRLRKADGKFLVEGADEITLALASGAHPEVVFHAPEIATRQMDFANTEVLTVNRAVFEKITYRDNPDGWIAVFPTPKNGFDDLVSTRTAFWASVRRKNTAYSIETTPFIIIAESIEKPGNLGAILRTADAVGADALIVCDPRVDMYNPNVVRASRGTLFSVPMIEAENSETLAWLRKNNIRILAATPSADKVYSQIDLTQPIALLVGAEDEGLSDFWLKEADLQVKIPMHGEVNSLNVSVSTAVIAYEILRQRANR